MEKLTHDAQTVAATILRTGFKQMETNYPGTEDCTWNYQDVADQPPMTNLKMTIRAECAVSARNTLLCL